MSLLPEELSLEGMDIDSVAWGGSVLSQNYGDGFEVSALTGRPAGLQRWTLSSGCLPGDSQYNATIDGLPWLDYYWRFFKRHTTGATRVFVLEFRGKKYHASFVETQISFNRFTDDLFGGGLEIKQRSVRGVEYDASDGSIAAFTAYRIDCGRTTGGTVAGWQQDAFYAAGPGVYELLTTVTIGGGVVNPAPVAVYQNLRGYSAGGSNMTYTLPGMIPGATALVRLHFADISGVADSQRVFDVAVNGVVPAAFNNIDVRSAKGSAFSALVLEAETGVSAEGEIELVFSFVSGTYQPIVNGIEVIVYSDSYVPPPTLFNVALSASGGSATATSTAGGDILRTINGFRHTNNTWPAGVTVADGGGWDSAASFPQTAEYDFGQSRTINEISVFTVRDEIVYDIEPTLSHVFGLYGIVDFTVDYWNGSSWVNIATVTGNDKIWRQFTFSPVVTDRIRIHVTHGLSSSARLVEVEAWGY